MRGLRGNELACIRGQRLVFDKVTIALAPGEALMLRGPNGAGKSSLLRLLAALLAPASGEILWDDALIDGDREAHRARVTYVGHLDAVKLPLTGFENLFFWAKLAKVSMGGDGDAAARTQAALERFGIAHLAYIPARLMSAGQRKRLNLARLAAAPTPLWLLDEPATSLDSAATLALREVITDHLAGGGLV
ncbi:MAG: heme ABC exporter ATP-binding protein CcmA, partial [Alphaproteobacteria bacterium]|nr:heme ABC exporter ATP-binding protein CcmA [Alphaproteobacteria bacterium]